MARHATLLIIMNVNVKVVKIAIVDIMLARANEVVASTISCVRGRVINAQHWRRRMQVVTAKQRTEDIIKSRHKYKTCRITTNVLLEL